VRTPLFGTGAKLIAKISVPTKTTERTPTKVVHRIGRLVHARKTAISRATPASGSVTRKTDPHQTSQAAHPPRAVQGRRFRNRWRTQRDGFGTPRPRPLRCDQRQPGRVGDARRLKLLIRASSRPQSGPRWSGRSRMPDRLRQRNIRDGQVQVGNAGDCDQRDEYQACPAGWVEDLRSLTLPPRLG
jgi:hypothetical protein